MQLVGVVEAVAQVKKRDGRVVVFDRSKIVQAIAKAAQAVQGQDLGRAEELADRVVALLGQEAEGQLPNVERIQDMIEKVLIEQGHARTAKAFILYRARRSRIREGKSELMETVADILGPQAPPQPHSLNLAVGHAASREYYLNRYLSEDFAAAHQAGRFHIHGLSHYASAPHSFVLPYGALLRDGFGAQHARIRAPKRAASALVQTGLMLQLAQADCFGGLAIARFDGDLADNLPAETDDHALAQAMEAFVTQLNAAPRLPDVSLHLGLDTRPLAQAVSRALLTAMAAGLGRGEVALRPHVVFRLSPGVNAAPGEPNYALTRLAAELASRSLAVTFVQDAPDAVWLGHEGRLAGAAGRGLLARLTLNLPRLAMTARRDGVEIERMLETALGEAIALQRHRLEALSRRAKRDFPFVMGEGLYAGTAEIAPDASLGAVFAASPVTVGFVGLAQALVAMSGQHHGHSPSAQAEGLALVARMRGLARDLGAAQGLEVLLQGSEAGTLGEHFARLDRRAFGIRKGVTDCDYASGVALPEDAALEAGARQAIEGAYGELLAGGSWSLTRLKAPPAPEAVETWLQEAVRSGGRAFALDFPLTVGGEDSRRVARRRGYMAVEA